MSESESFFDKNYDLATVLAPYAAGMAAAYYFPIGGVAFLAAAAVTQQSEYEAIKLGYQAALVLRTVDNLLTDYQVYENYPINSIARIKISSQGKKSFTDQLRWETIEIIGNDKYQWKQKEQKKLTDVYHMSPEVKDAETMATIKIALLETGIALTNIVVIPYAGDQLNSLIEGYLPSLQLFGTDHTVSVAE